MTNRQGLYGVITLGVAVLIITGAIDLSIGSVVGCSRRRLRPDDDVRDQHRRRAHRGRSTPIFAFPLVLALGACIGLVNGLLVTRLKLQAFLVTLCGLFIYRGLARYMTQSPVGLVGIKTANPEFAGPARHCSGSS